MNVMLRMEYVATYLQPKMDNSVTPAAAGTGSVEMDSSVQVRFHCFPQKIIDLTNLKVRSK